MASNPFMFGCGSSCCSSSVCGAVTSAIMDTDIPTGLVTSACCLCTALLNTPGPNTPLPVTLTFSGAYTSSVLEYSINLNTPTPQCFTDGAGGAFCVSYQNTNIAVTDPGPGDPGYYPIWAVILQHYPNGSPMFSVYALAVTGNDQIRINQPSTYPITVGRVIFLADNTNNGQPDDGPYTITAVSDLIVDTTGEYVIATLDHAVDAAGDSSGSPGICGISATALTTYVIAGPPTSWSCCNPGFEAIYAITTDNCSWLYGLGFTQVEVTGTPAFYSPEVTLQGCSPTSMTGATVKIWTDTAKSHYIGQLYDMSYVAISGGVTSTFNGGFYWLIDWITGNGLVTVANGSTTLTFSQTPTGLVSGSYIGIAGRPAQVIQSGSVWQLVYGYGYASVTAGGWSYPELQTICGSYYYEVTGLNSRYQTLTSGVVPVCTSYTIIINPATSYACLAGCALPVSRTLTLTPTILDGGTSITLTWGSYELDSAFSSTVAWYGVSGEMSYPQWNYWDQAPGGGVDCTNPCWEDAAFATTNVRVAVWITAIDAALHFGWVSGSALVTNNGCDLDCGSAPYGTGNPNGPGIYTDLTAVQTGNDCSPPVSFTYQVVVGTYTATYNSILLTPGADYFLYHSSGVTDNFSLVE